ncbi:LacI family DNA-binding transcriptional regulator [Ornithinimicrobium cerasi]|uniref:Transcriptional regulator, LacI family n=1 Tax=Ornithinimicrobium cerasi TaxID=2248773 RepID=A0A285VI91_9MICO|nr:LacI family DNA-binding transcriptional regulator [Ornithinimicrobium cerasi]SOC53792.1 transcriptional regulator, LacI family [Ornithinimicrobium cerasi]
MVTYGRVRMEDVARQAGVSVATVSKVVNGRYGVSATTTARVADVISELGYEASLGARSLRSTRTGILGVLVAEFEPFSTELLKGVSGAMADTDYELMAFAGATHGETVGWERRSLRRLGGTLLDGAIVVTPTVIEPGAAVPVVAIDPHTGSSDVPTVDSDNVGGARSAVEHLIGLGHTRIGMIRGREDLESARLREQGFRQAMAAAGLEVDETLLATGSYRSESAVAPALLLLDRRDRPTAVFAANDLMAIRTVEVARTLGLQVPADLSVVGFDNIPESALAQPALTTVAQPLREMGRCALDLLLSLLAGEELAQPHVRLDTRLVERASTGPPAPGRL